MNFLEPEWFIDHSFTHLATVEQFPGSQTVGERVEDQVLLKESNFRKIIHMFFIMILTDTN